MDQIGTKINQVQKEIGMKKKAKENADDLIKQKEDLQNQKKAAEENVQEKELALLKKAKTIGNYVHESVPISDNEVGRSHNSSAMWRC